jgi:REP element-mobilizing transposase RayT
MHIVYSTKNREPLIGEDILERLHHYVPGVAKNIGCSPIQVGGVSDHIHILLAASRTLTIADTVKELKTATTKWLKKEGKGCRDFAWQSGYAAASVSAWDYEGVIRYIQSQAEHHRKFDFKTEYRKFLEENGIEYDEEYVWD